MKRPLILSLTLLVILALGWTFKTTEIEGGKPEKIALKFLEAVEKGDYETAKKYGTEKTAEELDKLASLDKMPKFRQVTIKGSEIKDESAEVYYTFHTEPDRKLRLKLVKEGKKWLVETTKMDLDMGNEAPTEEELARRAAVENYDTSPWSTPKEVAKAFLDAVESHDWIRAKALSTEKTREQMDLVASMSKEAKNRKVTIIRDSQISTSAKVWYTVGDDGEEKILNLTKVEKDWRVETTKSEMIPEGEQDESLQDLGKELEKALQEITDSLQLDSLRADSAGR